MNHRDLQSGYVILISTVLISAICLAMASSLLYFAISHIENNTNYVLSLKVRSASDSCAELAMLQILNLPSYTGTANTTVNSTPCTYTVTNSGSSTINASSTFNSIVRKVKYNSTAVTPIVISNWTEVADF